MSEKWTILAEDAILSHPFLKVSYQRLALPGGRIIERWPIVDARNYINVVVLNQACEVLILEGYKHAIGRSSWQIVGGYLEDGEDPLATAQRELLEEAGLEAPRWENLGSYVVDANRGVSQAHLFLARDAVAVAEPDDGDLEIIALRWVSLEAAAAGLRNGRFVGLSYAAGLALALTRLQQAQHSDP